MLLENRNVKNLIIALFIILLGLVVFSVYRHTSLGTLKLKVVPNDAKIVIDGKKTVTQGTLSLTTGTHTLAVSRDGFKTISVKELIKAHTTSSDTIAMTANSQTGIDYLKQHPEQTSVTEGQTYQQGIQQGQTITKNTPIIKDLPYYGPGSTYEVNYGSSIDGDPDAVTIYITATSQDGINAALQWIQQDGYDPSKLSIQTQIGAVQD